MTPTLPDNWASYYFRPIQPEEDRNDDIYESEPAPLVRSQAYQDIGERIKK